jgi:magnesium-transporting ATPase (P-type)
MEHIIRGLLNAPLFIKIMLGSFVYSVIGIIILWIQVDKHVKRTLSYDDTKKERAIGAIKRLHRISFWISPLSIISIYTTYVFEHRSDTNYIITMMIMASLLVLAIHLLTRKILNKLNQ